ncbi:sigma-70 family RNA polymerase sigma factor [Bosea sp. RAC05]|uniref:sigma-70 family RNA polymerase sigma factor n=1 Tax=Bosea sp. RAC05 TaxID=1842539 RepID=UPI00083DB746|nr:sigma-70 family RNA polymerase sigma factor [Bosea sp. RAC05]AOG03167.1 RNA polymerase sigma factor, sigma-70 family protein [Bosea sp. RAC05]
MSSTEGLSLALSQQVRTAPYLTAEVEADLLRRWHETRDRAALDVILRSHGRLVMKHVIRLRHYGVPFDDLFQEAQIGLMTAAEKFCPDHKVRFSTYATWWIKAGLSEYVVKHASLVRSARSQLRKSLFFKARAVCSQISSRHPELSNREVLERAAAELRAPIDEVEVIVLASSGELSLNAPASDDDTGTERGDLLIDEAPLPDEAAEHAIDGERNRMIVRRAVEGLDPRSRHVIERRYLADADDKATLEDIAIEFGVTRERIRQIEVKAMGELRRSILRLRSASNRDSVGVLASAAERAPSSAQPGASETAVVANEVERLHAKRMSASRIAGQLGCDREQVVSIIVAARSRRSAMRKAA